MVSIFRMGWQKKEVRLCILQALHSEFREAEMRTLESHRAKPIGKTEAPGGYRQIPRGAYCRE